MLNSERLYRYILSLNKERIVGETWSSSKEQVLKDVRSNFGPDSKNISVV